MSNAGYWIIFPKVNKLYVECFYSSQIYPAWWIKFWEILIKTLLWEHGIKISWKLSLKRDTITLYHYKITAFILRYASFHIQKILMSIIIKVNIIWLMKFRNFALLHAICKIFSKIASLSSRHTPTQKWKLSKIPQPVIYLHSMKIHYMCFNKNQILKYSVGKKLK